MISYRHFTLLCSLIIFVFLFAGCVNETTPVQSHDVNQSESTMDAYDMPTTEQTTTTSTSTARSSHASKESGTTTNTATTIGQSVPSTSSSSTHTLPANSKIIPFTVGATVRVRDTMFEDSVAGKLIQNKTQLDALALGEDYETDKYTDDYFSSKALVVLEFKLTSGSMRLQIDNALVNSDTLTVQYTTTRSNPFTNDMACWRILLEVNKSDVANTEHITTDCSND